MKIYIFYLFSSLLFTLLCAVSLGNLKSSDILTVILSLISIGAGVTQSTVSSFILHFEKNSSSATNIKFKSIYKLFFASGFLSLFISYITTYALFLISYFFADNNNYFSFSLYLYVLITLACFVSGALSFAQSYLQRLGKIDYFYKSFAISTLSFFPFLLTLIYFDIGTIEIAISILLLKLLLNLVIVIFYVNRRKDTDGSKFKFEVKKVFYLIFSGSVSKLNIPFDRLILAMLGEGLSTVYHFISILFGAIGRYIDVNKIYNLYINSNNEFLGLRKNVLYCLPFIIIFWLFLFIPVRYLFEIFLSIDEVSVFNIMYVFINIILTVYMVVPSFLSSSLNSVLNLYYYEKGLHLFVSVISLISSITALIIKFIIINNDFDTLIPLILNINFVIMIVFLFLKIKKEYV